MRCDRELLAGADLTVVNCNSYYPLHLAARRGDPTIVQSMLEHRAAVDVVTPQLLTPLMTAVLNFHREDRADIQLVIKVLIAEKADLNAVDENGTTALTMAINHLVDEDGTTALNSDNNVKYGAPASVCIALIEAGQEKAPCQV